MDKKIAKIKQIFNPDTVPSIVRYFLRDEAISGKLIIVATAAAVILANSSLHGSYENFWHLKLSIGIGDLYLSQDLRHWINEGLMTFFFLMVGLEIKREIIHGELKKFQTAALPIAAAVGGMLVPALIYMAVNAGSAGFQGWAIPMATDIAFAIGLLTLLGRRVPSSLKLFLLTLAIVDDIGAIIVIAIFYGSNFNPLMFGMAIALVAGLIILQKRKLLNMPFFIASGIALWLAINAIGIHASISGALLGLLAPISLKSARESSLGERIEKFAIPVSTLFVVPLFAFANTGVVLVGHKFGETAMTVGWGIAAGLVLGKVIGIVAAVALMVKAGVAKLPDRVRWSHMIGVGFLAGIGFTVSIFVTELAFNGNEQLINAAKISIFAASAISGLLGLLILRFMPRPR